VPDRPHVTVPRKRRPPPSAASLAQLHYADVEHLDVADGIATGIELTLTQCLRSLPEDEALTVADSALRHGVPLTTLPRVAMGVSEPGSAKVRRIAELARAQAANPFESCLRWIASTVPGLRVEPQVRLPELGVHPDLVDTDLNIVLEADSFGWHGDRAALRRDAKRYVRAVLMGAVRHVQQQAQPCCGHPCHA
jgi:hypothetical protein